MTARRSKVSVCRPARLCLSVTVVWYAANGQPAVDVAARRTLAPWYRAKHAPSVADMLAALRRVLLAAQYLPGSLVEPTHHEILAVQAAWAKPPHNHERRVQDMLDEMASPHR